MDSQVSVHTRAPWWRQPGLYVVILIVLGIYFTRITALPFGREEPRWARVAAEMVETGDWFVPRQQGSPYIDRPPLASWVLAAVSRITGKMDVFAVRLPSGMAILGLSLIIYVYASRFLTPPAAFAAAVFYPTFGAVLPLGQVGENDALLALFVGASLLLWHYGWLRRWPVTLTWILGYGLAALGALQKGLQAPSYFVAATVVYLLYRRQWRALVSFAHLAGVLVFVAIVAAWWVPFCLRTDLATGIAVWSRTAGYRYRAGGLLGHVLTYPVEIWACLLPWSGLMIGLLVRGVRRRLADLPEPVVFMLMALAVTFPSVWFAADGKNRYFMPMFGCVAVVLGWMAERFVTAPPGADARKAWERFVAVLAVVIVAGGLALMTAGLWPLRTAPQWLTEIRQPGSFGVFFGTAAVLSAVVLLRVRSRPSAAAACTALTVIAAFVGLAHTGAYYNAMARAGNDIGPAVADIKARLPHPEALGSFGPISHRFAYYYGHFIEERPWPTEENDADEDLEYFCFDRYRIDTDRIKYLGRGMYWTTVPAGLPFDWELIAELPVDRTRRENPEVTVVIGRIIRTSPPRENGP